MAFPVSRPIWHLPQPHHTAVSLFAPALSLAYPALIVCTLLRDRGVYVPARPVD